MAAAPTAPLQGVQYGQGPPQHFNYTPQPAGWYPPPPHQWAPGGAYGGIQGAPQRFPNPYTMQQQPMAYPWYNPWTMQPNNIGYGAPYTMEPQQAMDQSRVQPGPSYG